MLRTIIAAWAGFAIPVATAATTYSGGLNDGISSVSDYGLEPVSIVTSYGAASSGPEGVSLAVTIPRTGYDRGDLYWTGSASLSQSFEVTSLPASGNGMLTLKFAVSGFSVHNGRFDVAESSSEFNWQVSLQGPTDTFTWYGSKWSYANGDNYETADGSNDDYSITKSRSHAFGTFLISVPLVVGTYYVSYAADCALASQGRGGARCKANIRPLPPSAIGLSSPATALAQVAAVPEPDVWVLMIAGFGLVGGTLRRRALVA